MTPQRQSFASGGRSITVEVFAGPPAGRRPAVLMLHGADGLSNGQYRSGAHAIAAAGYQVFLVHYLDRTAERRASFATVFQNFVPWMQTVRHALAWVAARRDVDPDRIGVVGISLGAALGLTVAGTEPRVRALVDYFGPLLQQGAIPSGARLPPTLDPARRRGSHRPVANAYAIENLPKSKRAPYGDQGLSRAGSRIPRCGAAGRDGPRTVLPAPALTVDEAARPSCTVFRPVKVDTHITAKGPLRLPVTR